MDHSTERALVDLLSDIQITYFDFHASGERVEIGLIDFGGREYAITVEGICQFSLSCIPGDVPPFTILECVMERLESPELEKLIPGYGFTNVRWRTEGNSIPSVLHIRLTGDVLIDLTCLSLRQN